MKEAVRIIENMCRHIRTLSPGIYNGKGPGQAVLGLSEAKRDIIKELKSSDLQNMRYDSVWGYNPNQRKGRWNA